MNQSFKTRQEIANELNISYKTLSRIIKQSNLDIPSRRLLAPADYQQIYDYLKSKD